MNNNKDRQERYEIEIEGSLTMYEVTDVRQRLTQLFSEYDALELSFKVLKKCDVAGIQLLYSVVNTARELKKEVIMTNIPPFLKEAIEKTGLDSENIIQ